MVSVEFGDILALVSQTGKCRKHDTTLKSVLNYLLLLVSGFYSATGGKSCFYFPFCLSMKLVSIKFCINSVLWMFANNFSNSSMWFEGKLVHSAVDILIAFEPNS